ncbi:MAG: hypothetical protein KME12_15105 [Trichocoleus desertorum ATA4-8-CV12]|jgi:hypothetical protein|nr:hypothetical protein [Trichocoleus desertorum ATA4-8-CV12]
MEYNSYFQNFGENDVLSFSETNMCKIGKFKEDLSEVLGSDEITNLVISRIQDRGIQGLYIYGVRQTQNKLWMTEGKKCEILKIGAQNWIKGRIKSKVIVEFEPEAPEPSESSLDDIRQMISE